MLPSLWTLWLPPTLQKNVVSGARLIGHLKLALGVNGCLSLCVGPAKDWGLVQDVP